MGEILGLITPLLLHMTVSELSEILLGRYFDPAVCTTITALVVIPAAILMYRRDNGKFNTKTGYAAAGYVQQEHVQTGRRMNQREQADGSGTDREKRRLIGFGIFCFAAGGVLNILWSGILNMLHIPELFSNQTQEALLGSNMPVQILGLGVLVPVAEELIFRGLIYTRMKRFFSVKMAIILSAVLFAIYHGNPIQMIFAFPMAVILAAVYEHGKAFVFPVLFHMGVNLTAVFVNFL